MEWNIITLNYPKTRKSTSTSEALRCQNSLLRKRPCYLVFPTVPDFPISVSRWLRRWAGDECSVIVRVQVVKRFKSMTVRNGRDSPGEISGSEEVHPACLNNWSHLNLVTCSERCALILKVCLYCKSELLQLPPPHISKVNVFQIWFSNFDYDCEGVTFQQIWLKMKFIAGMNFWAGL